MSDKYDIIDEGPRPTPPELIPGLYALNLSRWERYCRRLAEWKATRAERFLPPLPSRGQSEVSR